MSSIVELLWFVLGRALGFLIKPYNCRIQWLSAGDRAKKQSNKETKLSLTKCASLPQLEISCFCWGWGWVHHPTKPTRVYCHHSCHKIPEIHQFHHQKVDPTQPLPTFYLHENNSHETCLRWHTAISWFNHTKLCLSLFSGSEDHSNDESVSGKFNFIRSQPLIDTSRPQNALPNPTYLHTTAPSPRCPQRPVMQKSTRIPRVSEKEKKKLL